ncbi:F0F1 ATP synthase subunit B [Mangrovibrevibacter kandeliae]|uniref:F0F1 ATP synthase subunit B n=1 Tax=Mangrovibrevibacter kandeliae TaxID=2968473 RepID=UPI0021198D5F|nr:MULTISPECIES: F0F1 ATP synthase subunit B [unclassified Aurantimonas]MCQ8783783.1 F0F1 ATP synthase subunit B [Aurantimonas sp. CSK15Z-1]MCW4116505.1 F0F1 ATP synthase subunit B [Aurantimonas sp. MSK8Z-1]
MDETFWALVALIIFIGIVIYYKVPGIIASNLDQRAERIRNEIEEARELKEEAKQQLAEYQRRRREAESEAREIVAAAQREASLIVEDARQKSHDYVERRTAMAEAKIAQAESEAVAEVRSAAVNLAVDAATRIITERNARGENPGYVDRSIAEVRSRLQ